MELTQDKDTRYYKLIYFQGTHSNDKIFPFKGGLKDAILRGRLHCEIMGYRFGQVRPAIVNLEHQEKLKHSDPDWIESYDESNATKVGK